MIKILIADDSPTETEILKSIFKQEQDFLVVGCAKNGKEAIELTHTLKPDLITMDIQMPVMDGLDAIRVIMRQYPVPIVVISSKVNDESLQISFQALEAGALSVLEKPCNVASLSFKQDKKKMIDTLRSMAQIKVIKRRFYTKLNKLRSPILPLQTVLRNYEIVAIGSSVGGPQALKKILEKLPPDFSLPIVVVQHMIPGFISGFAKWLNGTTSLNVKIADNHEILTKGNVYFAPDAYHMEITQSNHDLMTKLVKGKPVSGFYPSVTVLFQSVANVCGKNAIGVLLTGMGSDGAKGLLDLKNAHAHTIIQDEDSAVVFGMAGVAQSMGAVDRVIQLDQIAEYLKKITSVEV